MILVKLTRWGVNDPNTDLYINPETIAALEPHGTDPRTDVYLLGASSVSFTIDAQLSDVVDTLGAYTRQGA